MVELKKKTLIRKRENKNKLSIAMGYMKENLVKNIIKDCFKILKYKTMRGKCYTWLIN